MSRPVWAAELARQFWELAGPAPVPRDMRRAVVRALPVTVVMLPSLRVRLLFDWLAEVGIRCPGCVPDRALRGALAARADTGFIFVAADDNFAEQRFTVAHELAHFLRDYRQPRERAVAALGPGVLEVLDGLRPPRPEEWLHATLRGASLGPHTHLMDRADDMSRVTAAEAEADLLACELLAPADAVWASLPEAVSAPAVQECLAREWGLPAAAARWYAAMLFPPGETDPFLARMKKIFPSLSNFGSTPGME